MMTNTMSATEALNQGFTTLKAHWRLLILVSVIYLIVSFVVSIVKKLLGAESSLVPLWGVIPSLMVGLVIRS